MKTLALIALLFAPAAQANTPALAQKTVKVNAKSDEKALIAQFFNKEAAKPGSALGKDLQAVRDTLTSPQTLEPANREDIWSLGQGHSAGDTSREYVVAIFTGWKSSTYAAAHYRAFVNQSDGNETEIKITIDRQVKVDIR